MRYPKLLKTGDAIGVCAPSSGVDGSVPVRHEKLDKAHENVRSLGYNTLETASVRNSVKCVSADAKTRAAEFMSLYENPDVAAIIPPWGGEFLIDVLPYMDFARLSELPPKWVCGYSDITTLIFPLTLICDMAAIHGANFMNMGFAGIHEYDMAVFEAMSKPELSQRNSGFWGKFTDWNDISKPIYDLTEKTVWKSLSGEKIHKFEGRIIGGCTDTLCKLLGTRFAPVPAFLEKYKSDGFIWTLESCEMSAGDIYRTLWQMRECGWFEHCKGVLYGRVDGYSDTYDFTLTDALKSGLGDLGVPVIYDADIGHIPPQIQIINGAYGRVEFEDGNATVWQEMRA
ncbi:MAG: LD-carboxypeptidase [Defluviitaleaceae bacterium]|nr:LD-carboxypeptidase [Defluviitaleaceae bacterium]MCL2835459.1 LD-carboxypeptidase [Defluviitaleaceae bacterium]